MKLAQSALLAAILLLTLSTAAQTLSGTVTNGTTGKSAVGDEVILVNPANGMDVDSSTKVDSRGNGVIAESPRETTSGAAQQQLQQPAQRRDNRPGGGLCSILVGLADRHWSRSLVVRSGASHP